MKLIMQFLNGPKNEIIMTTGVEKVSKWSNVIHKKRAAERIRIWMKYLSFFSPQQLYFVVNRQNSFCRFFLVWHMVEFVYLLACKDKNPAVIYFFHMNS